jgi:putative hydrolase of the HAD superfamily
VGSQRFRVEDGTGRYRKAGMRAPADLSRVRVITLDLDNTLWDIQPTIEAAERELHAYLSQHHPQMTADMPLSEMAALRDKVAMEYPDQTHDFTFLRKQMLRERALLAQYSPEQAHEIAEEAFDVFYRFRNIVTMFEDVRPALDWLYQRYRLISVSNGNADLEAIGIARYFDSSVWAREVGTLKPGALMYLRPLRDAELDPEHFLHVGDDPVMDVGGARAVGYQTAWIDRFGSTWPETEEPADFAITSLAELVELLKPHAPLPWRSFS